MRGSTDNLGQCAGSGKLATAAVAAVASLAVAFTAACQSRVAIPRDCRGPDEVCHTDYVAPIAWRALPTFSAADELDRQLIELERNALRYMLLDEVRQYPETEAGLYDFWAILHNPDYSRPETILHDQIRPPAQMASALSVSLALGEVYDPTEIGVPRGEARDVLELLLRSLAEGHVSNTDRPTSEGRWGDNWQSAHWAFFCGFAAYLAWDSLDQSTQEAVARVVVHESSRFDVAPPYANTSEIDTKSEENAWNANILVLAQAMMPTHPDAPRWRYRASQWLVGSYTRPSDLRRRDTIDGLALSDWVGGYNIAEAGYVYNHGLVHPDYVASVELALWNYLPVSLAGQRPSEAFGWNADVAYRCLQSCPWESPPYASPGGTMYRPGEALVYYPDGTDWSPNRVDNFLIVDVLFDAFSPHTADEPPPEPGLPWAQVRASHLLAMQDRSETGQLFIESDALDFPPKESFAAVHFAYALLGRWLARIGRVGTPTNWRACEADSDCDAPRACTRSVCDMVSGTCEARPVDSCEQRWGEPEEFSDVDFGAHPASPSMTDDGLELYFSRDAEGGREIWVARRERREDVWGSPAPIPEVAGNAIRDWGDAWDPFVSADGLTLLFASRRDAGQPGAAGFSIWQSTRGGTWRSWNRPTLVAGINGTANERHPQLTRDARSLTFVSNRGGNDALHLAERATTSSPWVLDEVAFSLLQHAGRDRSPVLSDDRRTLYFCSDREDIGAVTDVFVSERATESDPFGTPRRVGPLSSSDDDADLWTAWDEHTLMLTRTDGGGITRIMHVVR